MPHYQLDRLTIEHVQVEIPNDCPYCGAPLLDSNGEDVPISRARVEGYTGRFWAGYLVGEIQGDGAERIFFETSYDEPVDIDDIETSISCEECGHLLASTEQEVEPPAEVAPPKRRAFASEW